MSRRPFFLTLLILSAGCISGCLAEHLPEERWHVIYSDRNGDGRVDLEYHVWRGADRDWELRDDDFDGRYEKRVNHGFALTEEKIDRPVSSRAMAKRLAPR